MEVFKASLKDVPISRVMKVRHQLSHEYELLTKEHDFPNAHIRLRMIAIIDEYLMALSNKQGFL
jgi:hypothetical protein